MNNKFELIKQLGTGTSSDVYLGKEIGAKQKEQYYTIKIFKSKYIK